MTHIITENSARFVNASFEKLGLPDENAAVAAENLLSNWKRLGGEAQVGRLFTRF
jgi:hypothetical protein